MAVGQGHFGCRSPKRIAIINALKKREPQTLKELETSAARHISMHLWNLTAEGQIHMRTINNARHYAVHSSAFLEHDTREQESREWLRANAALGNLKRAIQQREK